MKTKDVISQLKSSNLIAQCPHCDEKFNFSDAILFDGTKTFPAEAVEVKALLEKRYEKYQQDLQRKIDSATIKAEVTTEAVNIGKGLEKIVPTMKDYKWTLSDSRFLSDPIDLIIFDGLARGKVDSISFIEVKTGKSPLNPHQKMVKRAVGENRITYREMYD